MTYKETAEKTAPEFEKEAERLLKLKQFRVLKQERGYSVEIPVVDYWDAVHELARALASAAALVSAGVLKEDETPKCICDGAKFAPGQKHPFLIHPECPVHSPYRQAPVSPEVTKPATLKATYYGDGVWRFSVSGIPGKTVTFAGAFNEPVEVGETRITEGQIEESARG